MVLFDEILDCAMRKIFVSPLARLLVLLTSRERIYGGKIVKVLPELAIQLVKNVGRHFLLNIYKLFHSLTL